MNGFKVTLYLNGMFNDHRSICRIFINLDKMGTIKDLQDHIAHTFNIKNFYLMVQNQFLPSTENIRILSPDDMISAIPLQVSFDGAESTNGNCKSGEKSLNLEDSTSGNEKKCVGKKRKRKVKDGLGNKKVNNLYSSSWINDADEDNDGKHTSTPLKMNEVHKEKELKRKKLPNKVKEAHKEKIEEFATKSRNSVKDKVEYFKKQIDRLASPVTTIQKPQPNEEENSQSEASNNFDEDETLNIADVMRKHKLYVKPNDCLKKISTELPQQHNIVKSIIVSMGTSQEYNTSGFNSEETSKSQSMPENTQKTIRKDITGENKINVLQQIILTPKKATETNIENITETSNNLTKMDSPDSDLVICDKLTESQPQVEQFVTKRKRVRVRKRKSKEVKSESKVVAPNFDFKMKIPKATPAIHIKFDEDSNEEKCEETIEIGGKEQKIIEEIRNDHSSQRNNKKSDIEEFVSNKDKANCIIEITDQKETNEVIVETEKDFLKYVSEAIDKHSLLLDSMPQKGNVIAFKLLKLSFSFTPELSNYIIGKVLDVSEDEKSVTVNILDGLEEAKNAIEDFSLNYDEDLQGNEVENTFTYEWSHLKEARLVS